MVNIMSALFTLSSFIFVVSSLRQPGMDMASVSPDRTELVEAGSTQAESTSPGCQSDTNPMTGLTKFSISFKINVKSTDGTQCIWCEDKDSIDASNRLTLEGKKLVLNIHAFTSSRIEFQPVFIAGEEYDVTVAYDGESSMKRVVLFLGGDPVQAKTVAIGAGSVNLDAGTFGCFQVPDTHVLQVQGNTQQFSLGDDLPDSATAKWSDWTTKQELAVDAARDYADVVKDAEHWVSLNQSVTAEKNLLDALWKCNNTPPETYATWTRQDQTIRNMTHFDCDLVTGGPTNCEDRSDGFVADGNAMMAELHTTYGNCDIDEVVTANSVSRAKITEVEEGRCEMGRQFLLMHLAATYVGAVDDMLPLISGSNVDAILSWNTTTRSVTFNHGTIHVPTITATTNPWPETAQNYTTSSESSAINLWNVEDNPNAFTSCLA